MDSRIPTPTFQNSEAIDSSPEDPSLPPGCRLNCVLSRARGGFVARVERQGEDLVLRQGAPGMQAEVLDELRVLAGVEHAGLASVSDFGLDRDGRAYVLRPWIEGRLLSEAVPSLEAESVDRLLIDLALALHHLHERGFVHGDLKSENVIVRESNQPVLTDYGLATSLATGSNVERGVSGSLFHIAPELLQGGLPNPAADLFSFGVLLHELFAEKRPTATEFYGRFPTEPFLDAADSETEVFPERLRGVALRLLDRDPRCRPAGALELAREIALHCGLPLEEGSHQVQGSDLGRLPWGLGREGFAGAFLKELKSFHQEQLLEVGDERDASLVLRELQLEAVLRGQSGIRFFDLDRELDRVMHAEGLDRWTARCLERLEQGPVVLSCSGRSHWSGRALDMLAASQFPGSLVLISPESCASAFRNRLKKCEIPPLGQIELCNELRSRFTEGSKIEAYVETLPLDSLSRLKETLLGDYSRGWVLGNGPPYRLREGVPDRSDHALPRFESSGSEALDASVRQVLFALAVAGGSLRLAVMHAAGMDLSSLPFLCGRDWASLEPSPAGSVVALQNASDRWIRVLLSGMTEEDRADGASLERLAGLLRDFQPERAALLHYLVQPSEARLEDWLQVLERVRICGATERAIDTIHLFAEAYADLGGVETPSAVLREEAMCWAALGELKRAGDVALKLKSSSLVDRRAAALDIEGELATRRRDHPGAVRAFLDAEKLDPNRGGRVVVARVRRAFAEGNDEVIDAYMRDLHAIEVVAERELFNARSLHAMSLMRRGKVDRARELLERELRDARKAGEQFFEAGARVNLGVLERRSGDLERAASQFESAVEVYRKAGVVEGLAQARALLGGTLRDLGSPGRARVVLLSALGTRERLGDEEGAAAVRGMAGLCTADCGEVREALDELIPAARDLDRAGRHDDALVLRTRSSELRARIGEQDNSQPLFLQDPLGHEGDPRSLLSMARAAWHRGEPKRAHLLARSAAGLASARSRTRDREESEWLLAALDACNPSGGRLRQDMDLTTPRLRQEMEVILHLGDGSGSFHPARAQALALDLEDRRRLDLAARLQYAIALHSSDVMLSRESRARAEELFQRAAAGLTESQCAHYKVRLLAVPDPWPLSETDLESEAIDETELDMDLTHFLEINRRLAGEEELTSLLGTLVECALEISGGRRGFLILEHDGELVFDTAFDSRRGDIEAPEVEVSESVVRAALEKGQPLRLSNAAEDPLLSESHSVQNLELRSILCTPFDVEQGLRGVIYVDHTRRAGQFGPRSEQLLKHLGSQAAIAIRQVRRMEQIQHLNERLSHQVDSARGDLKRAQQRMREAGADTPAVEGMVGSSDVMVRVRELIGKAAGSEIPVLVLGASGTGKEIAARAVHSGSPRHQGPWVSENCAALPESLIESELFGYRKGAFTGAEKDRAGMFERAEGGTIFLDEIGELPLELQAKLLRVLETGEIRRLGDSETRKVDFRLVAATNRDLKAAAEAGEFRSDLLYRLDGLRVHMPPLSRRVDDIPELVEHFLRLQNEKSDKAKRIAESMVRALCARPWPGNVRELANEVARLFLLSSDDLVDPELIRSPGGDDASLLPSESTLSLAQVERRAIENALVRFAGDKQKAAEALDISRAKIYQRLAQWREEDEARDKSS